jgi:hypothetical protein
MRLLMPFLAGLLFACTQAFASPLVEVVVGDTSTTYEVGRMVISKDGSVKLSARSIHYVLTYTAGAGGAIQGSSLQSVPSGGSGSTVSAIPSVGFSFSGWSDGITTANRQDINVQADLSVVANFSIDGNNTCPTPNPYVRIIHAGNTGELYTAYSQKLYDDVPPQVIQAFGITMNPPGEMSHGRVSSTVTTAGTSKLIVFSPCPGDIDITNKPAACVAYSPEVSHVEYTSIVGADPRVYCPVVPGATYYANMASQNRNTAGTDVYTCDSLLTCSHYVDLH